MNWRRGFVRLWIVGSLLWIAGILWFAYQRGQELVPNPFALPDAAAVPKVASGLSLEGFIRVYGLMAVLPPLGILAVGLLTAWILAGFRPR